MPILTLKLPDVKSQAENRPRQCPACQGDLLQRWGGQVRQVRDPHLQEVTVYRYRCCRCRHTFRHYPVGVDQAQQTQRLRTLAAVCWTLGLSYRGLVAILAVFGIPLSLMSAWRDVQARAGQLRQRRHWQAVRVLGVDGAWVRGWGEPRGVLVAIDLGNGQPVAIGYLDEHNPDKVRRWLEPLVKRLGVSVIVTDDLFSYRVVAEKLELEHQVCQFHVRRWVGKTLRELRQNLPEAWVWVVEEVKQLLAELPVEGSKRLFELWKQIPERQEAGQPLSALEQLRLLLIRLSEHWASYRVFDWDREVPWTNNATEQAIGRMKMRSRTVRGYKTEQGLLAALMVAGSSLNA